MVLVIPRRHWASPWKSNGINGSNSKSNSQAVRKKTNVVLVGVGVFGGGGDVGVAEQLLRHAQIAARGVQRAGAGGVAEIVPAEFLQAGAVARLFPLAAQNRVRHRLAVSGGNPAATPRQPGRELGTGAGTPPGTTQDKASKNPLST